jgi:hypothetical protein
MTLRELKNWIDDRIVESEKMLDMDVVIKDYTSRTTPDEPTPCKSIDKIHVGFDWDTGKIFLEHKKNI